MNDVGPGVAEVATMATDSKPDWSDAGSIPNDTAPGDARDALRGSCVSNGTLLPAGTVCRAAVGPCDSVETCDGRSSDCPPDRLAVEGAICRASTDGNSCDPAESCTGRSAQCPADVIYARPAAPSHVLALPGVLQVALAWSGVASATGYNVKRSTVSGSGYSPLGISPTTRAISFIDQGLAAGASYYYVVASVNTLAACESANSAEVRATLPALCVPPAAPSVTAVSSDSVVTLTWPAVGGATFYEVARLSGNAPGFVPIGVVMAGTKFTDRGLANGTRYSYVVTASNGRCSSARSIPVSTSPVCTPLDSPVAVQATPATQQIALSWQGPVGATFFWIYRSTAEKGAFTPVGITTTVSYVDRQVARGTRYYYRVAASNGSCWSRDSQVASAALRAPGDGIYDDALRNGWANWSWNGEYAFDSAADVHSGTASMAVHFTSGWAGLQLHNDTALSFAGKQAFTFWAYAHGTGTRQLGFFTKSSGGAASRVVTVRFTAGTWTKVTVSLGDLGNPADAKEIVMQETTGAPQAEFHIDELELVGSE